MIHTVVGVAGAGKTTHAMGLIERALRSVAEGGGGLTWNQIAFFTFSRAARGEAVARAAKVTGIPAKLLQSKGWFRTLHSAVMKCMQIPPGDILKHDDKAGKEFLSEHFGYEPDDSWRARGTLGGELHEALKAWDKYRATLGDSEGSLEVEKRAENAPPRGWCGAIEEVGRRGCSQTSKTLGKSTENGDTLGEVGRRGCSQNDEIDGSRNDPACQVSPISSVDTEMCGARGALSTPGLTEGVATSDNARIDETHKCLHPVCAGAAALSPMPALVDPLFLSVKECALEGKKVFSLVSYAHTHGISSLREGMIAKYEQIKEEHEKLDFADLLLRFAGISARPDMTFVRCTAVGGMASEVEMVIVDEAQDCGRLLWHVVERLAGDAQDAIFVGDDWQAIYGFQGSDGALLGLYQREAKNAGNHTVLSESFRNPDSVIQWGEEVLEEDEGYESRGSFSTEIDGSSGVIEIDRLMGYCERFANSDVMIIAPIARSLKPIIDKLNDLAVPWISMMEKHKNQWQAPAELERTQAFRKLASGDRISENEWRRIITDTKVRFERVSLFEAGAQGKWKKRKGCSKTPERSLDELGPWGAEPRFRDYVLSGNWRLDKLLLLDTAIEKFGEQCVLKPRIRVGTIHSAKGLEAKNVFCLAESSKLFNSAPKREMTCLKYVTITRAAKNYRLVVDPVDLRKGNPLFWAAPAAAMNEQLDWKPMDLGVAEDAVLVEEEEWGVPAEHRAAAAEPVGDEYEWFDL